MRSLRELLGRIYCLYCQHQEQGMMQQMGILLIFGFVLQYFSKCGIFTTCSLDSRFLFLHFFKGCIVISTSAVCCDFRLLLILFRVKNYFSFIMANFSTVWVVWLILHYVALCISINIILAYNFQ